MLALRVRMPVELSRTRTVRCLATAVLLALGAADAFAAVGSWSTTGPYGGDVMRLAVYEAGTSTLWAAGRSGVFRTTSGGASWTRIEVGLPSLNYPTALVAATTSPVLYVSNGVSPRVYRSGDGGLLWVTTAFVGPVDTRIVDLSLRRGTTNDIALATNSGAYVSADGGSTWTGPGGLSATAIYAEIDYASDGTLYLARAPDAGGAPIVKSTTGGASWVPTATTPAGFSDATHIVSAPSNAQRVYVANFSQISTSGNGGGTWSSVALPAAGCEVLTLAVHPTNPLGLFAACRATGVIYTADATAGAPVWSTYGAANGLTANGVDAAQVTTITVHPAYATTPSLWLGTQHGGLFASTTGGAAWSAINNGFQANNIRTLAVHPQDANVVLAGVGDAFTTSAALYRSPDSGVTWTTSNTGLNAEQLRNVAIDPTTVDTNPLTAEPFVAYAVGRSEAIPGAANRDGGVYKSTNGGLNWTTIDSGIAIISGRPFMGTIRGLWLDPRSCATPPVSGPCPIGSGPLQKLLIAGGGIPDLTAPGLPYRSARIYRSTNAGATWTPSEAGLPLPQDLGGTGVPPNVNFAYMGGVVPIVSDPTNPNTLYVGTFLGWDNTTPGAAEPTVGNGVFKSIDGGLNWVHSSSGLPRMLGPTSSHWNVLALAINPTNPNILYAAANYIVGPVDGRIYKSINAGATWTDHSTGISGQDVRALYVDAGDPTGNTVYAASGGSGSDPGGIYRTVDGGLTWNSYSLGLPADSATALAIPTRGVGAPARVLAGTISGVWEFTEAPDPDADGSPTATENQIIGGDGNGDGTQDAGQRDVASLLAPASTELAHADGAPAIKLTIDTTCTQLNNSASQLASQYPPDTAGNATSHTPWGLVRIEMPTCSTATVDVTFHGANFPAGGGWFWRNYGPRRPGDDTTFGWYTFAGAQRLDADTWRLQIDATRQGNYRADPNAILFIGGPALLPDMIFSNGLD